MKRLTLVALICGLLGVVLWNVGPEALAKDPTIKEIMSRLHKGAAAPLGTIKRDLQAANPPWSEIQKTSQEFVALGAALTRNAPPKGSKDSWAKLSNQYFGDAKAMDDAAKRMDRAGALAAHARLIASCNNCHNAHRN